jgi:hypothetical protein
MQVGTWNFLENGEWKEAAAMKINFNGFTILTKTTGNVNETKHSEWSIH